MLLAGLTVGSLLFAAREKTHATDLAVALDRSNVLLAQNYLDRGQSLCEEGEVAHGMLLIGAVSRSLRRSSRALGRAVRSNLAGWEERLYPLLAMWTHVSLPDGRNVRPAVAFSPDGTLIATGDVDGKVRFWNAGDAGPIGEPVNCSAEVRSLVFSPDGQTLAIACRDGKPRFWDVAGASFVAGRFDQAQRIYSIAYSHDGKILATGGEDGELVFWDAATGKRLSRVRVHNGAIIKVALAHDDKTIVTITADGNADLWNVKDGVKLAHASGLLGDANSVSPDGKWFAAYGPRPREVTLWDIATFKPHHSLAVRGYVTSLAFAPDSQTLLMASSDKVARLCDVRTVRGSDRPPSIPSP